MSLNLKHLAGSVSALFLAATSIAAAPAPYFKIQVTDADTGRGVPLVELATVHHVKYYTDSQGFVAFSEPGLMDQDVFLFVRSHGYEFAKDGFGYAGKTLHPKPGGEATLKIKRVNLAERLYRITGEGVYRDSVLLGEKVPVREPLFNAQVSGQDSVQVAWYREKLYWFWGDTSRLKYPLGHFGTAGATSEAPAKGRMNPDKGIDLAYFTNKEGFSRPTFPKKDANPIWIDGLLVVNDATGRERLVAHYSRMESLSKVLEHGLAVFNDERAEFETLVQFKLDDRWRCPQGQTVRHKDAEGDYFYFASPYPVVRVKAEWSSVTNAATYEAFTCVQPGGNTGAYGWQREASPLEFKDESRLIKAGKLKPEAAHFQLQDVDSGKLVNMHAGSVNWNPYRKRWIMIGVQTGGSSSYLGEVWFTEADSLTGPWTLGRKVATHEKYSFYNPVHHPFFDTDGGRTIYFQGTYSETFSGNPSPTPRYDYNQMMYRLDLGSAKLGLPLKAKN